MLLGRQKIAEVIYQLKIRAKRERWTTNKWTGNAVRGLDIKVEKGPELALLFIVRNPIAKSVERSISWTSSVLDNTGVGLQLITNGKDASSALLNNLWCRQQGILKKYWKTVICRYSSERQWKACYFCLAFMTVSSHRKFNSKSLMFSNEKRETVT